MPEPVCTAMKSALLLWVALSAGCYAGTPYKLHRAPEPDAPQATVKVRTSYLTAPANATFQRELLFVDGKLFPVRSGEQAFDSPAARATAVSPGWHRWHLETSMGHLYTTTSTQPHTVTESYSCGTSANGIPQTCTRTRTEYRSTTTTQTAIDGACRARLTHFARAGEVYRIGFSYSADQTCSFTCTRETLGPHGERRTAPCYTDRDYRAERRPSSASSTP